jgi:hypothetical protein
VPVHDGNVGAVARQPAGRGVGPSRPHCRNARGLRPGRGEILAGLGEAGLVDGKNLRIEYRYADEHYDRLPALATDLTQKRVAAIISTGSVISPCVSR